MAVTVRYHPEVVAQDIPGLPKVMRVRVKKAIEDKLLTHPELFGIPLRGSLTPLWKLRVGEYRIVYDIKKTVVYVHAIGHRKHIYSRIAPKRQRET